MPTKLSRERRPRIGRPPAGARAGEKVTDYPQLSVRLPAAMRAKLQALSVITGQSQWRLIIESIECHLRDLPAAQKREVDEMIARADGARAQRKRSAPL